MSKLSKAITIVEVTKNVFFNLHDFAGVVDYLEIQTQERGFAEEKFNFDNSRCVIILKNGNEIAVDRSARFVIGKIKEVLKMNSQSQRDEN